MLKKIESLFPSLDKALEKRLSSSEKNNLFEQLNTYWENINHGDYERWHSSINAFKQSEKIIKNNWQVRDGKLNFSSNSRIKDDELIIDALQGFMPWRKGPFSIGDIHIDTEWRSDWKWQRIAPHVQNLKGRRILDVGCGNGYFGYQMLASGAEFVLGVDRMLLFAMQHQLLHQLAGATNNWVLPLRLEDLPSSLINFDSVFSLGVLYHCKNPVEHIQLLKHRLHSKGEMILETFILPSNGTNRSDELSVDRYARMRNVYSIPNLNRLIEWVEEAGFNNIRVVDICRTSIAEQRTTEWMNYESLPEALNQKDLTLTIEGHPAPIRVLLIATA